MEEAIVNVHVSPRSPPGGLAGLSGLSARLQQADDDDGGRRSGDDYYDRGSYSRQSQASDRSAGAAGIGSRLLNGGRTSVAGEDERCIFHSFRDLSSATP